MASTNIAIRIGIQCTECMGPIPLNGLVGAVLCHHCQSIIDPIDTLKLIRGQFQGFWGHPKKWTADPRKPVRIATAHVETLLRAPACACSAPLDPNAIRAAATTGTPLECGSCSQRVPVRWADELARYVVPGARTVTGEQVGTDLVAAPQPILFSCLQYGAGLPVDGTQRVVACVYCKSSCFIPDALWIRMHPAAKLSWFHLCVD